ncbi:hypothetical protein JFY68_08750 [Porphyromonas gingivalis]|jgi:hypothetical protein|uniref:hypothetical protein n=1 Tax=Porphyromonas gingivalis TaxID=837 RepID=UPI0006BAC19D|nr:hypothetical protein [Porphyromonas gingivalis]KXC07519.1 hypothetical protein AT291_03155 [Porphyromonas gingivalis]MCE8173623.1 hypothetical protein [Porphyromonas gingivalis]MCE8175087.1 hypothetical protein [Porphyromonas gingivalis]GAP81096.1 hypothetical protein PGANDO_0557 [Porphyromonas gingivalis]
MSTYQTNGDKILQAVIADEQLINFYGYNPDDFRSISDALDSDITVIQAIAQIINRNEQKATEKEIYNEVSNYLRANI